MITLSLADTEKAVLAAWNQYLNQVEQSFTILLSGYQVEVTVVLRNYRFDCGTPGYNMANKDVNALAQWVPNNIKNPAGTVVGAMAACKNVGQTGQVNVYALGFVTFNFHVNLTNAC